VAFSVAVLPGLLHRRAYVGHRTYVGHPSPFGTLRLLPCRSDARYLRAYATDATVSELKSNRAGADQLHK
jgi:hypothetical protein